MPETPNFSLPYPSGTSLAAGHNQIQALADVLDDVLDASPRGQIGYAEVTANQGSITTETDLTGLSVTVDIPAGRRIKVTGRFQIRIHSSGDRIIARIRDGADEELQRLSDFANPPERHTATSSVLLTPSAGSHTYKLTLARVVGAGTVTMEALPGYPAFILVEDIGAADA